jgi:hypothetical protein
LHLEQFGRWAVVVAAKLGDGLEFARIDLALVIEHGIVDVEEQDLAELVTQAIRRGPTTPIAALSIVIGSACWTSICMSGSAPIVPG